jgi:hypothetical protein
MKTPFGTLTFIIAAVIAIAAVLVFRAFAQGPDKFSRDKKFYLKIGKSKDDFVDLKPDGKPKFDAALRALGDGNYQPSQARRYRHSHRGLPSSKSHSKTDKEDIRFGETGAIWRSERRNRLSLIAPRRYRTFSTHFRHRLHKLSLAATPKKEDTCYAAHARIWRCSSCTSF